jgi:hypothetical protein
MMTTVTNDFQLTDYGSVWLLEPLSDEAKEWCKQFLPVDTTRWGNAYVIEPRYVNPIAAGIVGDGLTIGR